MANPGVDKKEEKHPYLDGGEKITPERNLK
jgi:hypothetical protein